MTGHDRRRGAHARSRARAQAHGQGRATPAERALRPPKSRKGPATADRRPGVTGAAGPAGRARRRARRGQRLARVIWGALGGGVVVAVLLLFVFPTRTYLDQRHELSAATQRVRVLSAQNADLAARVDKLHTDAEIERLAREQYHLVRPGEQAFAILPAPAPTTTTTTTPPAAAVPSPSPRRDGHRGWWQRLTSWL